MSNFAHLIWARSLATVAVCAMGYGCMRLTQGSTGVGWALLGVFFIWAGDYKESKGDEDGE